MLLVQQVSIKILYLIGNSDSEEALNYEANETKLGDAVYETSSRGTITYSWYSDYSSMPYRLVRSLYAVVTVDLI